MSGSDLFALGHYPGNPIYPGVLLLDRLISLAGRLATGIIGVPTRAMTVKRIQYLDAVLPGDIVEYTATVKSTDATIVTIAASVNVGGSVRARATIKCDTTPATDTSFARQPLLTTAPLLSHRDISGLLPHRYPFLLVDQVHSYIPRLRICASKAVNRDSLLLGRNPPSDYPHGLAIEAGIALFFLSQSNVTPSDILLGSISDVELRHTIPYDTVLTLDVGIERLLPNAVVFSGDVRIGEDSVIRIGSLVAMIDQRHTSHTET